MSIHYRWYRTFAYGAVLLLTLLAGCSISSTQSEPQVPDQPAANLEATEVAPVVQIDASGTTVITMPQPVRSEFEGGKQSLSLAGGQSGPSTLDPALVRDAESSFIARQLFRGLTRLNNALEPVPDLAERIEISNDGTNYQFTIRADATFQDGATISAQDVVDSFNRATDPELANGDGWSLPAGTYLNDIEGVSERLSGESPSIRGIEVIDATTLRIQLEDEAANFLYKLSGSPALIVDTDTAGPPGWWQDPNASGPFSVAEFTAGERLKLEAVENYWAGAPYLDTVEIRFGSDASNPLNLYESGQIQIVDVPYYAIDRVLTESDPLHSQLRVVPQFSTTFIVLNQNVEPYTDPAVRKAFFFALDREKIVDVSYESKVLLANGLVPPGISDQYWDADTPPYDLQLASLQLESVGSVTETASIYGPGGNILIVLKESLEEDLGFSIEVIDQSWPDFSALLTEKSLPAFILTWIADYPDPENFLTALFHSKSSDNYSGYANEKVDQLLDQASAEPDLQLRVKLYQDAQQLIIDDGVLIPVLHDIGYTLVSPAVRNLQITPVGIVAFDDVWIEN